LYETRRRRAVHDVVVEGVCQVEQIARLYALLDDGRIVSDASGRLN